LRCVVCSFFRSEFVSEKVVELPPVPKKVRFPHSARGGLPGGAPGSAPPPLENVFVGVVTSFEGGRALLLSSPFVRVHFLPAECLSTTFPRPSTSCSRRTGTRCAVVCLFCLKEAPTKKETVLGPGGEPEVQGGDGELGYADVRELQERVEAGVEAVVVVASDGVHQRRQVRGRLPRPQVNADREHPVALTPPTPLPFSLARGGGVPRSRRLAVPRRRSGGRGLLVVEVRHTAVLLLLLSLRCFASRCRRVSLPPPPLPPSTTSYYLPTKKTYFLPYYYFAHYSALCVARCRLFAAVKLSRGDGGDSTTLDALLGVAS